MSKFLESCRQCYALIGLAIVAACVFGSWAAGWLAAELGHMVGLLPFEWVDCPMHSNYCSTESYQGPESAIGFMFFGVLAIVASWLLWNVAKYVFGLLESLGHGVVQVIKERRA